MKVALAMLIVLAFVADSAAAQIPSSTAEIRSNPARDAWDRGAVELARLVACGLERRETLARNILATRPGSRHEQRLAHPFRKTIENCFSGQVQAIWLGGPELRGAIAEQFYLHEYPQQPDFTRLDHRPMPLPGGWTVGKLDKYESRQLLGQDFASCIVAADPATVDAMLRSPLRGPEEKAVFRRLVPQFGPCLPNGFKMELDVAWLRAVTAEALLRSVSGWQPRPTSVPSTAREETIQ